MDRVDQAFWQLFHAVEDRLSDIDPTDLKPAAPATNEAVAVDLNGPPHALGVLPREAERRGDLPEWWLSLARTHAIGAPPA